MKIPIEWYPWPMEQTLSREAIGHIRAAILDYVHRRYIVHAYNTPDDGLRDELENCANHIRAWLQRQPANGSSAKGTWSGGPANLQNLPRESVHRDIADQTGWKDELLL